MYLFHWERSFGQGKFSCTIHEDVVLVELFQGIRLEATSDADVFVAVERYVFL
jgi:hypothetical protein